VGEHQSTVGKTKVYTLEDMKWFGEKGRNIGFILGIFAAIAIFTNDYFVPHIIFYFLFWILGILSIGILCFCIGVLTVVSNEEEKRESLEKIGVKIH